MEEIAELRFYIEQGRYAEALTLIGEMEEMSKDDKIGKIRSYLVILLLHLIKQRAEKRSTRSWEVSIRNALSQIHYTNKRRKAGGLYLSDEEVLETVNEAWPMALRRASIEVFEGRFDELELLEMVNKEELVNQAMELIRQESA